MAGDAEALAQHRRNQAVLSVYAERDQLRAENERLRGFLRRACDTSTSLNVGEKMQILAAISEPAVVPSPETGADESEGIEHG